MSLEKKQAGWQVVFTTELRLLWSGWRGPLLLFVFSAFLSVYIFLLAIDPEINEISQRKMIEWTIQLTVLVGVIAVLLLGSDAFSGERDRRTLENMLLTPVPRGQLALGKLLAILSLWLGMLPIAIPYVALVAKGTNVVTASLLLLIIPGTLLVVMSAGIALIISSLSSTNLFSLATAFAVVMLLAAPTQLPGSVKDLPLVHWFIVSNPITAVTSFQAAVIDGLAWTDQLALLLSPVIALILAVGPGLFFINRRLTLQGGFKQ